MMSSLIIYASNKCCLGNRIKEDKVGHLTGDEKCVKMLVGKRDGNKRFERLKYITEANNEMNFKYNMTVCT
jgi:hypothetical protein